MSQVDAADDSDLSLFVNIDNCIAFVEASITVCSQDVQLEYYLLFAAQGSVYI